MSHAPLNTECQPGIPRTYSLIRVVLGYALLGLCACDGGTPGKTGGLGSADPRKVELLQVHWGRLADVYGLRTVGNLQVPELVQTDVLLGWNIQDQRQANDGKADFRTLYDFFGSNPDTLQPRLLIPRDLSSAEFATAFAALDDQVRFVSADDGGSGFYPVVPRNAALRLSFSADLEVDDSFFVQRDALGQVVGVKNTQAVQLLESTGGANNSNFRPIAVRVMVRGNEMILDPVLLGSEGLQYSSQNSAAGLPASLNQHAPNIRLALALEGPLALPGLHKDPRDNLSGLNNDGFLSVVRDFRAGNQEDDSSFLTNGFIRDAIPPRLLGRMQMYLEGVDDVAAGVKQLTIYKNGIAHELDQGDALVLYANPPDRPIASLEVLQDPGDDLGQPGVQKVRVLVRSLTADGADLLESLDPSNMADYPPAGPERDAFLVSKAPLAVLQAEFTSDRTHPFTGNLYGDDPRNFVTFSPEPLADSATGAQANANVSPFAGAVLRFSKPMDLGALRPLHHMFFATRNLFDRTAISQFLEERGMDPILLDSSSFQAKFATPHLIFSQVLDQGGSQSTLLMQPTQGFYLDEAMREAAAAGDPFKYHLHLQAGSQGITDLAGNPLDLQSKSGRQSLVMDFTLDTRTLSGSSQPRFADNLAVYVVRRFQDEDEDERPSLYLAAEVDAKEAAGSAAAQTVDDLFGPVRVLPGQDLRARETSRFSKVVDDRNQAPPPPQTSPGWWCPKTFNSSFASFGYTLPNGIRLSADNGFIYPIQNPLNPYGCRLQTLWREIDLSLSRDNPNDFNLDMEQMYWCPFRANAISFDEFDHVSLYLGHSEFRPELCVDFWGITYMPKSGIYLSRPLKNSK